MGGKLFVTYLQGNHRAMESSEHDTEECVPGSCYTGYYWALGFCNENICDCDNGLGATGTDCPNNGDNKCESCFSGFALNGNQCKPECDGSGYVPLQDDILFTTHLTTVPGYTQLDNDFYASDVGRMILDKVYTTFGRFKHQPHQVTRCVLCSTDGYIQNEK